MGRAAGCSPRSSATLVVGGLASSKIGGVNGDVLGATEVVAECLCLVVAIGLATHGQLWWPG